MVKDHSPHRLSEGGAEQRVKSCPITTGRKPLEMTPWWLGSILCSLMQTCTMTWTFWGKHTPITLSVSYRGEVRPALCLQLLVEAFAEVAAAVPGGGGPWVPGCIFQEGSWTAASSGFHICVCPLGIWYLIQNSSAKFKHSCKGVLLSLFPDLKTLFILCREIRVQYYL